MKRKIAIVYAVFLLVCMIISSVAIFYFAWQSSVNDCIKAVIGFFIGVVFAPILHELGHILFSKINKMEIVQAKFFCFRLYRKKGKLSFSFASPFAEDETQVLPKSSENMSARTIAYALGGVIVEGTALLAVVGLVVALALSAQINYLTLGILPYFSYLFLLNIPPFEYANGKTDICVYRGIKKGESAEKAMITAMEIQGLLYSGKSFSEIDESVYQSFPVLPEDEPMFSVILDLKYRYYLDKNDLEKAGDCLNRLVAVQEYLPALEVEKIASELLYIHSINGDMQSANECGKYCEEYLKSEDLPAKRALIAYSMAFGKTDAVETLFEQSGALLETERIQGVKKFEENLLSRLKNQFQREKKV